MASEGDNAKGALDGDDDDDDIGDAPDRGSVDEELQDIKIRTMYRMVKEVDLSSATGRPTPASFLYLTNKQAMSVTLATIPRLLEEMNITDIEMVLHITQSAGGKSAVGTFPPIWGGTGHSPLTATDALVGTRVRWLTPDVESAKAGSLPGSWGRGDGEWSAAHERWKERSVPRDGGLWKATYPGRVVGVDVAAKMCTVEWDLDKSRFDYRVGCEGHYDLAFQDERRGMPWYMSHAEEFLTDVQFDKFVSDVLLPVAAAHRALIVFTGLNYCDLAVKVGSFVAKAQKRLGSASNFTVLAVAHGAGVYRQSRFGNPGRGDGRPCIARALKLTCPNWKWPKDYCGWMRRDSFFGKHGELSWQNMDFVEGVTHYIVVEDMSWDPTTKVSERNCEGFEALQNTLIHGLQIAKPTMVVAAGPMDYGIGKLIDLARRGVPTLLLDCRRRRSDEDSSTHVEPVSASSARVGLRVRRSALWQTDVDIFDPVAEHREEDGGGMQYSSFPGTITSVDGSDESAAQCTVRWANGSTAQYAYSQLLCQPPSGTASGQSSSAASQPLVAAQAEASSAVLEWMSEVAATTIRGGQRTAVVAPEPSAAADDDELRRLQAYQFPPRVMLMLQHYRWHLEACLSSATRATCENGGGILQIGLNNHLYGIDVGTFSFLHHCVEVAFGENDQADSSNGGRMPLWEAIEQEQKADELQSHAGGGFLTCVGADGREWTHSALVTELISWYLDTQLSVALLAVNKDESRRRTCQQSYTKNRADVCSQMRELLMTRTVRSGSIFKEHACAKTLWEMARMDRLPDKNSLEALRTLRSVWDSVDEYLQVSRRNKVIAKGAYLLLLLLGIATTSIATLIGTGTPPFDDDDVGGVGPSTITALSLLTSFCIGIISFLAPVQKWQQLRATASQLESETWKFRTRTCHYARIANGGRERASDRQLIATAQLLRRGVIESASIKDTSFFSVHAASTYRHGQRHDAIFEPRLRDDHYSVLRPDEYITLRVRPMLAFYKSRLPRYFRVRAALQVAQLLTVVTTVVFSLIGWSAYATILAALVSSLTAWGEFYGANKKLARYSTVIAALHEEISSWDALTEVERHAAQRAEDLISNCEALITGEREAWLATSPASKNLEKALSSNADEKEDKAPAAPDR